MTTIHAKLVGDQALLARSELQRLLEPARQSEAVELQVDEEEVSSLEIMRLAEKGGAFDFWKDECENIYFEQG